MSNSNESKCPFPHGQMQQKGSGTSNNDWWPNRLNLGLLRQHSSLTNPLDGGFNYAEAIRKLEVVDFPLTVINDTFGADLYNIGRAKYEVFA